jgi:asparagine synthase (glutamine-hydrolysing)
VILARLAKDGAPADPKPLQDALGGGAAGMAAGAVALAARDSRPAVPGEPEPFGVARAGAAVLACCGRIYNARELRAGLGSDAPAEPGIAPLALALLGRHGAGFAGGIRGPFAYALAGEGGARLVAGRDPLGIEPLYHYEDATQIVVGSAIAPVLRCAGAPRELDRRGVARFLLFDYNPGPETLLRGVHQLRAGHLLEAAPGGARTRRYWHLSFAPREVRDVAELAERLLVELRDAVRVCLPLGAAPGVFVSGGMDSSTVLGLLREAREGPIRTYSYRCRSESFDESHYARLMAGSVGAEHAEAEYRPDHVRLLDEFVAEMQEPFCDVGINVATVLLGRAASGKDTVVLTGDGGDELFGGHPVYEADKIARFADLVPAPIRKPILALLQILPDSDRKKNLTVKLKRFAESLAFPPELLSDRWRLYYTPAELEAALTPELAAGLDAATLLDETARRAAEGDGPDPLSRSLHADYQNVVGFYLRRNDLIRPLGVEVRYPLLDPQLVAFCASIPSRLKVRGWFDTKWILREAVEGVLPHAIVHRQDKLGHSIPLKNWLRDDTGVREYVLDLLSEESVRRRGVMRPAFVAGQISEHLSRRRNNSHRLWALAVLEAWCRRHLDDAGAGT